MHGPARVRTEDGHEFMVSAIVGDVRSRAAVNLDGTIIGRPGARLSDHPPIGPVAVKAYELGAERPRPGVHMMLSAAARFDWFSRLTLVKAIEATV